MAEIGGHGSVRAVAVPGLWLQDVEIGAPLLNPDEPFAKVGAFKVRVRQIGAAQAGAAQIGAAHRSLTQIRVAQIAAEQHRRVQSGAGQKLRLPAARRSSAPPAGRRLEDRRC